MALDIYSMLGGMGPPAPTGPTRADAMTQIQEIRDQHIPQEYAQMEAADAGAAQAYSAGSQAADLFLASTLGVPERVERGFTDAAVTVADTADQLGKGVRGRDEMMAGDIYQSLARAGQDTGVATALQDIAGRSQGVINAMGGFTVENLLKNASAAGLYANQVRNQGAQSFRNAGKMPAGGAARGSVNSGYEAAVGDAMRGLGEQSAKAAGQAADDRREREEFIVNTALKAMAMSDKKGLDFAKLMKDAQEFGALYGLGGYYPNRDDDRAAAAAADDSQRAAEQAADDRRRQQEQNRKRREAAQGVHRSALSQIEAAATGYAADLAKGYTDPGRLRPGDQGYDPYAQGRDRFGPRRLRYSYQAAYERMLKQMRAAYATTIRSSSIRPKRVDEIVRAALAAAGFAP